MSVTKMSRAVLVVCALLGALLCCGTTYAQRSPTITYITQTQMKDIGGTAELACSVQYTEGYSVMWMKVDKLQNTNSLPISMGRSLILHDSKFSFRYDPTSSTYLLQINDIQETDAGFYQCQILISPSNRVTDEVELQVRIPPLIFDNSTRSVVVSEGEDVEMECYAGGYPLPKIQWRRENNAILPTGAAIYHGSILKIKQIKKEDRGTYYCVAKNGVGRGTKRNIAVQVEFAPVLTVPRLRLGQALQFDMDMDCQVEAYPPPAITWENDGNTLSNNQHYRISHFATADDFTDSTLRVITIDKRQYGLYVCRAANKLGTAEGTIELFETVNPVCPPACDSATTATLEKERKVATTSTSTAASESAKIATLSTSTADVE